MPKISLHRSFPSFDPARCVVERVPECPPETALLVGLDIGSAAPCVALSACMCDDHQLFIYREVVIPGMGLERFIAEGHVGPPTLVDAVAVERAAAARSPLTGRSAVSMLEEAGYAPIVARSSPFWRQTTIDYRLRQAGGTGGLMIHPDCLCLIAALVGHRSAKGYSGAVVSNTPQHQHAVDACGYLLEIAARWALAARALANGPSSTVYV